MAIYSHQKWLFTDTGMAIYSQLEWLLFKLNGMAIHSQLERLFAVYWNGYLRINSEHPKWLFTATPLNSSSHIITKPDNGIW